MLDLIKRFREVAAWAVIALVVGTMIFSIVQLILVQLSSRYTLGQAALSLAGSTMGLTPAIVLLAVVALCVFLKPSSRRAPTVTLVAAIVVSVGAVLTLVFDIIGLTATLGGSIGIAFELLGSLTDVILKVLVATALWILVRGQKLGVVGSPLAANTPSRHTSAPGASSPTISPPTATGSGWRSANEAARGAPAADRGTDGGNRQWRPVMQKMDEEK